MSGAGSEAGYEHGDERPGAGIQADLKSFLRCGVEGIGDAKAVVVEAAGSEPRSPRRP